MKIVKQQQSLFKLNDNFKTIKLKQEQEEEQRQYQVFRNMGMDLNPSSMKVKKWYDMDPEKLHKRLDKII